MAGKRITDQPLVTEVRESIKMPTGEVGDLTISVGQLKTYIQENMPEYDHDHQIPDIVGLEEALDSLEPAVVVGTPADYYRGDKTFRPLNKAAVGLANVDNTSDSVKPVSAPQAIELNKKIEELDSPAASGAALHMAKSGTNGQLKKLIAGQDINFVEAVDSVTLATTGRTLKFIEETQDGQKTTLKLINSTTTLSSGLRVLLQKGSGASVPSVFVGDESHTIASQQGAIDIQTSRLDSNKFINFGGVGIGSSIQGGAHSISLGTNLIGAELSLTVGANCSSGTSGSHNYNSVFGFSCTTVGRYNISAGHANAVIGTDFGSEYCLAIGTLNSVHNSTKCSAVGSNNSIPSRSSYSTVVGTSNTVNGNNTNVIGRSNTTSGSDLNVLGNCGSVTGNSSVVLGTAPVSLRGMSGCFISATTTTKQVVTMQQHTSIVNALPATSGTWYTLSTNGSETTGCYNLGTKDVFFDGFFKVLGLYVKVEGVIIAGVLELFTVTELCDKTPLTHLGSGSGSITSDISFRGIIESGVFKVQFKYTLTTSTFLNITTNDCTGTINFYE